jgi:ribonuclease D
MGVPSNVVLPRDVLNRIAWENPKNLEELEQQMQDVPYRFDRFGQAILEVAQNGDKPSQYDVG